MELRRFDLLTTSLATKRLPLTFYDKDSLAGGVVRMRLLLTKRLLDPVRDVVNDHADELGLTRRCGLVRFDCDASGPVGMDELFGIACIAIVESARCLPIIMNHVG